MCGLQLKKVWSEDNGSLYSAEQRRFTMAGYSSYWLAVDAVIKFWDKTLCKILIKKAKKGEIHPQQF